VVKPKIIKANIEKPIENENQLGYVPTNDAIHTAYYLLFGTSLRGKSELGLIAIRDKLDRLNL
jgi:hypothetical protein